MPVPDRQNQRQEYLRKKAEATSKIAGGNCLFAGVFFCTIVGAFLTFLCFLGFFLYRGNNQEFQWYCIFTGILTFFTIAGRYGVRALDKYVERARQEKAVLPYVPPVAPDILPEE